METGKKEVIFEAIRKLAIAKGKDITKERIQIYAEYLDKYDLKELMAAIEKIFRENKFFPDISEIIEVVDPPVEKKDIAIEYVGKVIRCISQYGPDRYEEVKKEVGCIGQQIIERFGGWGSLCQIKNSELQTVRAQLREIGVSLLSTEAFKLRPEIEHNKQGVLE